MSPKFPDKSLSAGGMITMFDDKTNGHWLIAEQDRSFTFDVGLVDISTTRTCGLKANKYNMIFVDPTAAPDGLGGPFQRGARVDRLQVQKRPRSS